MTTTEALAEEAEETIRLIECLRRRRRRCVYGPRELKTTMVVSVEEDRTEESATTTEAFEGDEEYTTRPKNRRQRWRRRGIDDRAKESTITM